MIKLLKSILVGVFSVVVFAAIAIGLLLSNNLLYKADVKWLNIEEFSGYSSEVAIRNYDAVIKFLSPFHSDPFSMPDIPFSESGAFHFEEVKNIVVGLYIFGAASLCANIIILLLTKKQNRREILRKGAIVSLIFPIAIGTAIALNFDRFFVLFHKVFFNNDYWMFDYRTDPVITILPEEFFMHCAIFIAFILIAGFAVLFLLSRKRKGS